MDNSSQTLQDKINKLLSCGALTIKNGSVTLNFDQNGILMEIKRNDVIYRKKKE